MNEYISLENLRSFISLASGDTSDDTELKKFIKDASRDIDKHCFRRFYPYRTASPLKYNIPCSNGELRVNEELLEVKGLSDLNGSSAISNDVYWLKNGDEWNSTPYDRIIIDDSSGSQFNYSGTPQRAIHIDAIIGYHSDYSNAWCNSNASLTANLSNNTGSLSLSGSSGDDSFGNSSRIQTMNLIKIDEEFMYVKDGNGVSGLFVVRGINGTSAVTHASGAIVYVWKPEDDVVTSCKELSAYYYTKSKSPYTGRVANLSAGIIELPDNMPPSTSFRLNKLQRKRVYSI